LLEESLAHAPARTNPDAPTLEEVAGRVEDVLARLKQARPHLEGRIDRAATYLVLQLSSSPRTRPIRCRVRKTGKRVYLVDSVGNPGVVYEVDPSGWSCTCRDFFRNGLGCKHALSAFTLASVNTPMPSSVAAHVERIEKVNDRIKEDGHDDDEADDEGESSGCAACQGTTWVFLDEDVLDSSTGEIGKATNPVRCRSCSPVEPPYLSDEEMAEWMDSVRWRYAKTMPRHPHDYTLREWNNEKLFERVVLTIWDRGYDRIYLRRPWRSLDVGEHYIWVAGAPPKPGDPAPVETTALINRARRVQDELGAEG